MITSLRIVPESATVVNVASVPHRSPFRYPGGKTWLIPQVRAWLKALPRRPRTLVEPFAGGAIVGLTVAAERLADNVVLGELDQSVAAVWKTILTGNASWLVDQILAFKVTRENVIARLNQSPQTAEELAFQTILRNRVQRGGILAPGASLVRHGENGKGVASRWYPQTLARRIREIVTMRSDIAFIPGDALDLISRYSDRKTAAFFVDPPYTAGGKRAGSRLYAHNHIDHEELFARLRRVQGVVLMTYDDAPEVHSLAVRHGFHVKSIPMKNSHHAIMQELLITNLPLSDTTFTGRMDVNSFRQCRNATNSRAMSGSAENRLFPL